MTRLAAGGLSLRRAGIEDLEAVLALQRAAYARNRVLLGREPLPLLADYAEIFRDMKSGSRRRTMVSPGF